MIDYEAVLESELENTKKVKVGISLKANSNGGVSIKADGYYIGTIHAPGGHGKLRLQLHGSLPDSFMRDGNGCIYVVKE